jgi:transposase-like protein
MPQKRRSQAEWTEIIREFKASGETADEFARPLGVKRSTLLWWRSKLRSDRAPEPQGSGFVEVVAEAIPANFATVVRVGQVAVEFNDGPPPASWVAELASHC